MQQKQTVSMTAGLLESIEMLQLSGLELNDLVAQELLENPCLDYEDKADGRGEGEVQDGRDGADMVEWDMAWDQWAVRDEGADGPAGEMYGSGAAYAGEDEAGARFENRATRDESLQDVLVRQFDEIVDDPRLRFVGRFLIDAVDEAGYLRVDMAEVAARLRVSEDMVDDARAILQTLEPAGVGARDLAECLRLQLHARGQMDDVMEVCLAHLDRVAAKDFAGLVKLVNKARLEVEPAQLPCEPEDVVLAIQELQTCNPKPAAGYGSRTVDSVVPDVVVRKADDAERMDGGPAWRVELNGAAFPRLLAFPPQGTAHSAQGQAEEKAFLKERFTRAKWLVNALEQRAKTTLSVARAVVGRQTLFFDAGVEFLQPLTLREVAEGLGIHESTVSRTVSGKFMQTPWGVVGLKTFFASGVGSVGGQVAVASTSVQAMIAKMVKAEDPKKPLSDEQIVTRLKDEGVMLARRTVAKYRGVLGIPGTSERRVR